MHITQNWRECTCQITGKLSATSSQWKADPPPGIEVFEERGSTRYSKWNRPSKITRTEPHEATRAAGSSTRPRSEPINWPVLRFVRTMGSLVRQHFFQAGQCRHRFRLSGPQLYSATELPRTIATVSYRRPDTQAFLACQGHRAAIRQDRKGFHHSSMLLAQPSVTSECLIPSSGS